MKKSTEIQQKTPYIRPFLKWAGSKHRLLSRIYPHLPQQGVRLVEPFVGSGAVFLNSSFKNALIAELNPDVINLYKAIKSKNQSFIETCRGHFTPETNQKDYFYIMRERFNASSCVYERAHLFLYLNRHGYNGLCRYNKSGGYNVPFGRYKKPYFPEAEIQHFLSRAKQVKIVCQDFEKTMSQATLGDVVYCDPPYAPINNTSDFTQYQKTGFTLAQQECLAINARELSKKGIPVIISNHDTVLTRELYEGATIESFDVPRFISQDIDNRKPARELLAVYTADNS